MVSLIGAHYSRNGIKQFPARVVLSMYSNGLGSGETHPDTITILRDTRVFPSGEAPPDFHTFDPQESGISWNEYGRYWYSDRTEMTIQPNGTNGFRNFKEAWDVGQPANYHTVCNEQGGGEGNTPAEKEEVRRNVQRTCDIERAIAYAANADGRKCCVGNFAGGSPGDFELWKEIVAPFIVEMWENGGNIYGRHVYGQADKDAAGKDIPGTGNLVLPDGTVKPGQPQRVIDELKHLQSIGYRGGVVLTECGLDGGYGVADLPRFTYQMQAWEAALRPYSDILIGFCVWECGDTGFHADYTDHLKTLVPYMQNSYLGRWEPAETTQPPDGGGGTMTTYKWKATIHTSRPLPAGATHVRLSQYGADGTHLVSTRVPVNPAAKEFRVVGEEEIEDETENPNPPSVVNPLPQGALVVDVSYANDVNLAELKEHGVQGVIIRASNGIRLTGSSDATGIDIRFWQHLDEAVSLGLEWGSYHYCNENYDDFAQVEHFCGIIQSAINEGYPPPSLGLWLDFETPSDPAYAGAPKEEHRIQALCAALMQLRPVACDIGVYTSKSWWDSKVPNAGTWVPALGIKQWVAAWPAESALVNGWPPATWHPYSLKGFTTVNLWQWTSKGGLLVGHNVASLDLNFVGDTAVVPAVKPPDPPTGATVDLLPYMMGAHKQQHTLQYTWAGGGTHGVQSMHSGSEWKIVKGTNGEYEQLYYDSNWIYRAEDTSESPERFYTQSTNGTLGAAWIKRHMEVGEVCYTTKQVQHYLKAGCVPQNGGLVTDKLTLEAIYATFTFDSGITLPDVAFITWAAGEGYYFAKGYGLVGFKFSGGKSYISELALQGRPDLPINKPGCIDLSGRFYV